MENLTLNEDLLILEGLKVTSQFKTPAFILLLLSFIFIIVSNMGLVVLIFRSRSLRQPMYLLFCNLVINDIFGAAIIIPHVLKDILILHSERHIHYISCVVQSFCVHFHGIASHTVLMVMAFDRYQAICNPLRYTSIMTNRMVVKLSVVAWGSAFVMVVIPTGLTVRLSRCRRIIPNLFCDNASLFNLSCENIFIDNIYGLAYTVLLLSSSIGSVTLTYLKIAAVCVRSKSKSLNRKALQTCASHLALYVLLVALGFIVIILHRFPQFSDHRKIVTVMGHIIIPALNAVIYGVQIKEIRQTIKALFHIHKLALKGK
ncbi:olfactory receptor 8U1-like [Sphaeramia orbicularis]|uniref:Olfactory receptor 8U1-like n=1 Tax=Sphaeramia orbicularis TaxID=375764 RepID=A0A672YAU9_9TELE|nr:olfactory receptor 8U1-like [Sphaeramia orbicularis]